MGKKEVSHMCYTSYPGPRACLLFQKISGKIQARNVKQALEIMSSILCPLKPDFLAMHSTNTGSDPRSLVRYEWNEGALRRYNARVQEFKIIKPESKLHDLFAAKMSASRYKVIKEFED